MMRNLPIQFYTQYATQAAAGDKAHTVHAGITSASREAIRPTLARFKTLYFYNTQYEGGVCDYNNFCTGSTPAQTVAKIVPHAMKKWGKKVYIVAADYNYGQITCAMDAEICNRKWRRDPGCRIFPIRCDQLWPHN